VSSPYGLLDWERLCDECPEVHRLHDSADFNAEYGMNWYEFIYTHDEATLFKAVDEWWADLPVERKQELVNKRLKQLSDALEALQAAVITGDLLK